MHILEVGCVPMRKDKVLIGIMVAVLSLEGAVLAGKVLAARGSGEERVENGTIEAETVEREKTGNAAKGESEEAKNLAEQGADLKISEAEKTEKDSENGNSGTDEKDTASVTEAPRVALTFDDGPNAKYTPKLLDGLQERGISATFFLMGKNVEENEDLVGRMQEEGHLIGNHTYDHVELNKVSEECAVREIQAANLEIYEVTGVWPMFLRPPYGAWKKDLELSVAMLPVLWDVDTLDWKSQNVDSILEIIKRDTRDGSIILMHDAYQTSVDAALQAADYLAGEGYRFVTVDELLLV